MKLNEIADMTEYLAHRCYCPGEIYSFDGFFYQIFDAESECVQIAKGFDEKSKQDCVVVSALPAHTGDVDPKAQLILIYIDPKSGKVDDCMRVDATDNNIALVKELYEGGSTKRKADEYDPGSTARSLNTILSLSDAVMVSR